MEIELTHVQERLERLRSVLLSMTVRMTGLPRQQMRGSRLEDIAITIMDLEHEVERLERAIGEEKIALTEKIMSIADPLVRKILTLRYLRGLSLRRIALLCETPLKYVFNTCKILDETPPP